MLRVYRIVLNGSGPVTLSQELDSRMLASFIELDNSLAGLLLYQGIIQYPGA